SAYASGPPAHRDCPYAGHTDPGGDHPYAPVQTMRLSLAAIQMECTPFAVRSNLERAENSIRQAAANQADLILLPELFNTGLCYDPRLGELAEPVGGRTTRWMRRWSLRTRRYLGGSLLGKGRTPFFFTLFPS